MTHQLAQLPSASPHSSYRLHRVAGESRCGKDGHGAQPEVGRGENALTKETFFVHVHFNGSRLTIFTCTRTGIYHIFSNNRVVLYFIQERK